MLQNNTFIYKCINSFITQISLCIILLFYILCISTKCEILIIFYKYEINICFAIIIVSLILLIIVIRKYLKINENDIFYFIYWLIIIMMLILVILSCFDIKEYKDYMIQIPYFSIKYDYKLSYKVAYLNILFIYF